MGEAATVALDALRGQVLGLHMEVATGLRQAAAQAAAADVPLMGDGGAAHSPTAGEALEAALV